MDHNGKNFLNRREFFEHSACGLALLSGAGTLLASAARAAEPSASAAGNKGALPIPQNKLEHTVELKGLRLKISTPRVLAKTMQGVGGHCYFPDLLRFATGEWMLTHSLNADSNTNMTTTNAVFISGAADLDFKFQYDINGFHNAGGEPRICLPDGRIIGPSMTLRPTPAGPTRRFVAHRYTFDRGGRRYSVEPWGVTVEGFPRDVKLRSEAPSRTSFAHINWFSDIIALEVGTWVSTISCLFEGDKLESTVAVVSNDEGINWQVVSTISGPEDTPEAGEGFDEPCLVRLANGDLLCLSRIGNIDEPIARAFSSDGGRSWSKVDFIEPRGVAPQIVRTANNTLMLSTGRPGIQTWFSQDSRGDAWQKFDLMAFHNRVLDEKQQIKSELKDTTALHLTTAYTAMWEVAPNRVYVVYDRNPLGWKPLPPEFEDVSRIYLIEFELERI